LDKSTPWRTFNPLLHCHFFFQFVMSKLILRITTYWFQKLLHLYSGMPWGNFYKKEKVLNKIFVKITWILFPQHKWSGWLKERESDHLEVKTNSFHNLEWFGEIMKGPPGLEWCRRAILRGGDIKDSLIRSAFDFSQDDKKNFLFNCL
jgi:hypothetical protein